MTAWQTVELAKVATVLSGFAFDSTRFSDDAGTPLVRIRDVSRGWSDTCFHGDFDPKFMVNDGDLLVGMDGQFNREYWKGGEALLNQRVCRVTSDGKNLDQRYLYHFLPQALRRLEDETPFVTVKHLSSPRLKSINVPLPPLEEQRRIAGILDHAEGLQSKRRCALDKLDMLRQSIFLEMFGDPVSNPKDFPRKPLGAILSRPFQNGAYFRADRYRSEGGVEMVHMSDAFKGIVHRGSLKRVAVSGEEEKKYALTQDDLIVARRSLNYLGSVKPCLIPAPTSEPLIFESSLIRITPNDDIVGVAYLYSYLSNSHVREQFVFPFVTQATISGINQRNLAQIQVLLPPRGEQKEFAERIQDLDALEETHRASLTSFGALFASLMHRAFRGEL